MKKKIASLVLAALVFTGAEGLTLSLPQMTTIASAATSVVSYSATGTVNTTSGNLNVRKDANTSSTILGKLAKGTKVTIVGKTSDGKWYKIKYNNGYGFVSSQYVKVNSSTPAVTTSKGYVKISSGNLNVRKSPNTSSAILGKLANGTEVTLVGNASNGWYKIKYNNGYGYVSSQYITKTKPTPTPTPNVSQARKDIIARAQAMVDMKWTTPKQFSGWKGQTTFKTGTKYTGMPYSQTGNQMTSPSNFTNSIKNYSGSLTLTSPQTQPRFGNDCSGFVSAAWGISRHTTSTLPNVSKEISYNDLQPGDILNHAGDHTFIFKKWANANKTEMVVLEQTPPHAIETIKTVSKCKARPYTARRLNTLN